MKTLITILIVLAVLLQPVLAQQPPPPTPQPQLIDKCIVAIIVVAIGIYVVVQLVKICDRCLPPSTPPSTPPATNQTHKAFVSLPPGSIHVTLNDAAVTYYDISAYSATNQALRDYSGNPYTRQFFFTLGTTTNLAGAWQPACTVTGWCSGPNTLVAVYISGSLVNVSYGPTGDLQPAEASHADGAQQRFFKLLP